MSEPIEIRLAHTADNHLRDTQFARKERGRDFTRSLENAIDIAHREKVHAILNSGDMLDSTRPSPYTIQSLNRLNRKLIDYKIPMLTVSGNHDRTEPHWIEVIEDHGEHGGIKLIDHKLHTLKVGDAELKILGMPFLTKEDFLIKVYEHPPADVLVWHAPVLEFVDFPMPTAITLDEFPKGRFQLIAMGDIHVHRSFPILDAQGRVATTVAMPGSTELCASNEEIKKFIDVYRFKCLHGKAVLDGVREFEVPTRKVLCYRIMTEDDVPRVLQEMQPHLADNPLILVRFNRDVDSVVHRLTSVVDTNKAILRSTPIPKFELGHELTKNKDRRDDKQLLDFLGNFIPPGTPLFETAQLMLDPKLNERDILDRYVEKTLGKVDVTT